jgi:GDNF/GAS1 domain.
MNTFLINWFSPFLRLLGVTCKDLFSNFNYLSSESSKISCSAQCRRKLKRARNGLLKNLLTCKTDKSHFFPYQDRAERCIAGKIDSKVHDNYVQNGCSKVFEDCIGYNGCRKRYEVMMYQCSDMVAGKFCSSTCEKALRKFLVSRHTRGFYQCKCDGAFYFQKTCHSLKKNIVNLCISKQFKGFLSKRKVITISRWKTQNE